MNSSDLSAIIFDFDGVLTDDRVWVDQDGREMVCCSRRDGLAFDVLRHTNLKIFILSTEKNPVVAARARKLRIEVAHGSTNKAETLQTLAEQHAFSLSSALYVGNDINDLDAMQACGHSACPSDAHPAILSVAQHHLATPGGQGVAREVVEKLLGIDLTKAWHNLPHA